MALSEYYQAMTRLSSNGKLRPYRSCLTYNRTANVSTSALVYRIELDAFVLLPRVHGLSSLLQEAVVASTQERHRQQGTCGVGEGMYGSPQ